MNAHEKGIEAALRIVEDDWNVGSKRQMAASMGACISAYLEASGMVMVPREPTHEMMQAAFEAMFVGEWDGTQAPMIGAGFDAAIAAAPSPFSQANTEEEKNA